MTEYQKSTDLIHQIPMGSKIVHAFWIDRVVCVADKADLEVWTHFVGTGSDIEITAVDKNNKTAGSIKGKVYADFFAGSITVPEKAAEELTFTANLPKHNLELKSGPCRVIPQISITNLKWGQKEARRGDVVKLTADAQNIVDGTEVMLLIYEFDRDDAHDFITKFPCRVQNAKITAEWEYEYHEDTDEIPTDEQMQKSGRTYNPPEYFWVVDLHGKRFGEKQESGLLGFKDWIEIKLMDVNGDAVANVDYKLHLPDGSVRDGQLNNRGTAMEKDVPPGKYHVEFPNYGQ